MKKTYAGVAVKNNNKILFCKRSSKVDYPGIWSIPGGTMEEGEKPHQTARREFFEEMAVDIDHENLKKIGVIPRYSRDGKKLKGEMHVFEIEPKEIIIPNLDLAIDGDEHTECGYYSLDQMPPSKIGEHLHELLKNI